MKAHFASIHSRLRRDLNKPGRRRALRLALLKAGSFETWVQGPLHQLSRQIVTWCSQREVGILRLNLASKGDLPWAQLASLIRYKAAEAGIRVLDNTALDAHDTTQMIVEGSHPWTT